jgi:hypothetical protein
MRHLKTALTVLGALAVLLLAGNTVGYAATGKPLLLGSGNSTGKQTILTRTTNGAVLGLRATSPASAPFTTNGRGRVANLNADKVDGLDSSALRTRSRVFTSSFDGAGEATVSLPLPVGTYLVSYSVHAVSEFDAPVGISCAVVEDRVGGINDVRVASDATEVTKTYVDHAMSGSGLVNRTADATVKLECDAVDGEFRTGPVAAQIVVTPTVRLSQQALAASVSSATPS